MSTEPSPNAADPAEGAERQPGVALADRLLGRITRAASAGAIYGAPVVAHGRTVIPVVRAYYALIGGGGGGEGRQMREGPERRAGGSGAGGGGVGLTLPAGYIELSPEGTRYVAISANRDRLIGVGAGVLLGLALARLLRR